MSTTQQNTEKSSTKNKPSSNGQAGKITGSVVGAFEEMSSDVHAIAKAAEEKPVLKIEAYKKKGFLSTSYIAPWDYRPNADGRASYLPAGALYGLQVYPAVMTVQMAATVSKAKRGVT